MSKTCVYMKCPFLWYCKNYSLTEDRENCETRKGLMRAARLATVQDDVEYCLQTNCLGCEFSKGRYKDCPYFERKKRAQKKQGE